MPLPTCFPTYFQINLGEINLGDLSNWGILSVAVLSLVLGLKQWKAQFNHQQKVKFLDELSLLVKKLQYAFAILGYNLAIKHNKNINIECEEIYDSLLKDIMSNTIVIETYIERGQFMKFKNASILQIKYNKLQNEINVIDELMKIHLQENTNEIPQIVNSIEEEIKEVSSIFETFLEENYKALYL